MAFFGEHSYRRTTYVLAAIALFAGIAFSFIAPSAEDSDQVLKTILAYQQYIYALAILTGALYFLVIMAADSISKKAQASSRLKHRLAVEAFHAEDQTDATVDALRDAAAKDGVKIAMEHAAQGFFDRPEMKDYPVINFVRMTAPGFVDIDGARNLVEMGWSPQMNKWHVVLLDTAFWSRDGRRFAHMWFPERGHAVDEISRWLWGGNQLVKRKLNDGEVVEDVPEQLSKRRDEAVLRA